MNDSNMYQCSDAAFASAIEQYKQNPRDLKLCRFLQREYITRGMANEARDMGVWIKALTEDANSGKRRFEVWETRGVGKGHAEIEGRHWAIIAVIVAVTVATISFATKGSGGFGGTAVLIFLLSAVVGVFPLIWAFIKRSGSKFVVGVVNVISLIGALLVFSNMMAAHSSMPILAVINVNLLSFGALLFWVTALVLAELTKEHRE